MDIIMAAVNYTVRLDESDKKAAEKIFNELGLTLAAGFNIYIKAVIRQKMIPFDLALKHLPSDKSIPTQQTAAQEFLSAIENVNTVEFTLEDKEAFERLKNGEYKLKLKNRLS